MHILAALDLPTSGYVTLAGTRLGELSDTEITKLRRKHIGFIFQFFNLLPMLTAEENILLPLSIAGRKPDKDEFEELLEKVGLQDRRSAPAVGALGRPAAAGRRSRARSSRSRPWSSPTSRPGTSTRRRAARSSSSCTTAVESYGQTMVMVTHDAQRGDDRRPGPLPRRRADRPATSARADEEQILETVKEVTLDVIRVALRGLAGRKLRAVLTAFAIVLGVAMVSGTFVLTDAIDEAFKNIFSESVRREPDAVISGKSRDIKFEGEGIADAVGPGVGARRGAEAAGRRGRATGRVVEQSAAKILDSKGKVDRRRAARPRSGSASTSPSPASTR